MVPEMPSPGRLTATVKDHKDIIRDGIPPLREVVSGSGSNTEMISGYVDHHAKKHVKNLDINLEDTAHCLREIDGMNVKGPQPPGTIPVTWDIIGLYPNVPH